MCTTRWTAVRGPRPLAARDRAGLELLQRPRRTHRPPQEDPLDGGLRGGAAAAGPEGERRTTSAGRPAGLRLTTQWHRGNPTVGSSPSRPRRCPPGVTTGCRDGAAPSERWPVPDPSGTVGRRSGEGPSDAYSEGPSSRPGRGFPQLRAHVHKPTSPERPRVPPSRAKCPVQSTEVVPSLCTEPRSPLRPPVAAVDIVCTPRWTAPRPPAPRPVRPPSPAAAAAPRPGPPGCAGRPGSRRGTRGRQPHVRRPQPGTRRTRACSAPPPACR